jgi:hypothetical protein
VREERDPVDVPDCIQPWRAVTARTCDLHALVHHHVPLLRGLGADGVQTQPLGGGSPAQGREHLVGDELFPRVEVDGHLAAGS